MKKLIASIIILSFCIIFLASCSQIGDVFNGFFNQTSINTQSNYFFFPTEKSQLHIEELTKIAEDYFAQHSNMLGVGENFEIYNLISESDSEKYNLDIFQVQFENYSFYLAKHNDDVYHLTTFSVSNELANALNHIAITDINGDGYIEILSCCVTASSKSPATSNVVIVDTKTKTSCDFFDFYEGNLIYFKENEDGVISIYSTNGKSPTYNEIQSGNFAAEYYNLATTLVETPVLNTSEYKFNKDKLKAACELYSVDIEIIDSDVKFPYLLKSTYPPKAFSINVKMTYLGKSFSYVNGTSYMDGATVSFVNSEDRIDCEGWGELTVVTPMMITTGMIIDRTYIYRDNVENLFAPGVYDMVITYKNEHNNINESIVIENFLTVSR